MAKKKNDADIARISTDDPGWPYYGASKEICRILGRIYEGYNPLELFRAFVEISHVTLDGLPNLFMQVVQKQPIQDTPELAEAWRKATGRFKPETLQLFAEAFQVLLAATQLPDGELSYADVIGEAYQEFLPGGKWRPHAQFFTPWNVASMMAQMTMGTYPDIEQEFKRRWMEAVEGDPALNAVAQVLGLMAGAGGEEMANGWQQFAGTRLFPQVMQKIEPFTICDPCCGSGVMLLAAAHASPRWLIDIGYIQFYGVDIDPTCVEMAKLNLRLYNIARPILKAADALTLPEAAAQPWPYDQLYTGVIEAKQSGDSDAEALFRQGVEMARAQQLEMWPGLPAIMDSAPKPSPGRAPARKRAASDDTSMSALFDLVPLETADGDSK